MADDAEMNDNMDMAGEENAMMENEDKEMMMDAAMMEGMEEEEIDELKQKLEDGGFMCCCCLCQCTTKETKELSCCCFLPIKCGVLFIGVIILAITLFVFLEIFYELLNDDIHWWYVLVGVLLASTLVVASAFTIVFFTKDDDGSRRGVRTACIMVIVGVSCVAIWSACYFVWLYKKDSVTTGNDGVGFVKATRKQEVVVTLYVACCIDALFAYFICVVNQYINALAPPEEEEEKKGDDEENKGKDEKADEKSNKSGSKKGSDKGGEGEEPAAKED